MFTKINCKNNIINNKKRTPVKKIIIILLAFFPIWLVVNFLFAYDSFMGPGVFEGKEIINYQNLILNASLIIILLLFMIMSFMKNKKIALIIPIALVPIIGYLCFGQVVKYYSDFSPQKWNNHKECRYLMYDDMIKNTNLIGKNMKEVEDMLGDADSDSLPNDKFEYNDRSYYIIHDTSWLTSISIQYLVIHYDHKGLVDKYDTHTYTDS